MNTVSGARIDSPDFDDSSPDYILIRASWGMGFCTKKTEWVVMPAMRNRGFVCFCYVPIPDDWTYFVVERLNKNG